MQPDPQIGQAPGTRDGIGRSAFTHHQAGAGQYAGPMGRFDRFIDGLVESEIIG